MVRTSCRPLYNNISLHIPLFNEVKRVMDTLVPGRYITMADFIREAIREKIERIEQIREK